jgi:hypothetical protein
VEHPRAVLRHAQLYDLAVAVEHGERALPGPSAVPREAVDAPVEGVDEAVGVQRIGVHPDQVEHAVAADRELRRLGLPDLGDECLLRQSSLAADRQLLPVQKQPARLREAVGSDGAEQHVQRPLGVEGDLKAGEVESEPAAFVPVVIDLPGILPCAVPIPLHAEDVVENLAAPALQPRHLQPDEAQRPVRRDGRAVCGAVYPLRDALRLRPRAPGGEHAVVGLQIDVVKEMKRARAVLDQG